MRSMMKKVLKRRSTKRKIYRLSQREKTATAICGSKSVFNADMEDESVGKYHE